jgi:hypothetical protein
MKLSFATDGVDPDSKNYNRTSLSRTVKKKYKIVVKLLLVTDGIGLEFKNYNGRTSSEAAMNAHKIDVNSKNSSALLLGIRRADQIRYY